MSVGGGVRQAGTDQIDVTILGVGGHGSAPQYTKDPVVMAALAVVQYQTIISRALDPSETAVLTVGSIQAGTDNNVIPESAALKINTRFFSDKARQQMIEGIRRIDEGIAKANGLPADKMPTMVMKGYSPPLVNDAPLVERVTPTLKTLLGEKNVVTDAPPVTASEDFHVLTGGNPTRVNFMLVGTADPALVTQAREEGKAVPFGNHSPKYLVDLRAIPIGATIGAMAAFELLAKGAPVMPKLEVLKKAAGGR
jgi:hippurate hydrolase